MRSAEWRCAACGCAGETVERGRGAAGLPDLADDALACGQRCALALVERELVAATRVIERIHAGAASEADPEAAEEHEPTARLTASAAAVARTSRPGQGARV